MIELKKINKYYDRQVLNDICLQIEHGEMIAIMGKSGAGKSTLLNILGMIDSPSDGDYYFDDINVSELNIREKHKFRKKHFSYIFQNYELLPQYTVFENVEIPLLARGIVNGKKIIEDTLDQLGILELKNKKPGKLSGGEQQRVAIARALVADTDVILADEPTGSLDEDNSIQIMKLLQEINNSGKTILIVTHDDEVAAMCGRIIEIKDGKIY